MKNRDLLERAKRVTPVASQTYSKSYRYFCGDFAPYFLEKGKGAYVWDVDGRKFTDYILALGPITVGYANDEVDNAIKNQLTNGISFSQSTELEVQLAEKLVEIIPCAEQVRLVKNGSDATTGAIKLARAYTGKNHIAVCGYHGMHDWYIGSTNLNEGIPKAICNLTHTFEYNDINSLKKIFTLYPNEIGAVILEPIQGENPNVAFLKEVKRLTHSYKSVLIFDEVISGFRVALGGAQELYGIIPDMASIGKGMANGMPLSAIVGKTKYLQLIEEGVFISTTFGGETLSIASALKTIEILSRENSFKHIWECANLWFTEVKLLIETMQLDRYVKVVGEAPHSGLVFLDLNDDVKANDILSIYQDALMQEGILSLGINNFCLSHSIEDVQFLIKITKNIFVKIQEIYAGKNKPLITKKIKPIFKRN